MDNLNNRMGIKLALENLYASKEVLRDLVQLYIDSGNVWILNDNKMDLTPSNKNHRKEVYEPSISTIHSGNDGRFYSGRGREF